MRVQVENTGTLSRRMTVSLPAEQLEQEISARLVRLSQNIRMPGFRPGKAPRKLLEAKYGAGLLQEVAGELMHTSFRDALGQEGLNPAGKPAIEPKSLERGHDLEYVATFEVYPDVGEIKIANAEIERPQCEIEDADIDRTIENMRKQRVSWDKVFREAGNEDRVTIDFVGTIDSEPFEGGEAKDFPVVLGSGSLLSDFETGLVGVKTGEKRSISIDFPENYPKEELAGKHATFAVEVKEVAQSRLPEVDEDFAKALGIEIGGVDKLRAEIKENLARELDDRVRAFLRTQVMQALLENNKIDIPERLVEEEIDRMVSSAQQQLKGRGVALDAQEVDRSRYQEEARRRVALGIIVIEVVKSSELKVDAAKVRARLDEMAVGYDDPAGFIQWHYADRSRLSHIESIVLEEQVVEHLLEKAQVVDKPMTFSEFMYPAEAPADQLGADNA
ncbi:MAG: trigger factor [Gammaproteobacteria bacterium]|nr:trigger factor [Gammaproteobacteria bacterium]